MLTLKAKGIRVPEDVAIVGFSDEPFTKLVTPTVSTVSQHSLEMGDAVGTLFLLMIEEDDTQTIRKVVLEPTLMVRQSSLKT
jgi:LacI family transcriptional regulator